VTGTSTASKDLKLKVHPGKTEDNQKPQVRTHTCFNSIVLEGIQGIGEGACTYTAGGQEVTINMQDYDQWEAWLNDGLANLVGFGMA